MMLETAIESTMYVIVMLIGTGVVALISQEIAELAFGCQVDLNRVIPCVIGGRDYGQTFYDLGFLIWYSYLSLPLGGVLLGLWAVAALIAFIVTRRKKPS